MVLVGVAVLILLAGFLVSVIVTILELLAVIMGIALIIGGLAMLLFGRRVWRRGPWGWGPPTHTWAIASENAVEFFRPSNIVNTYLRDTGMDACHRG